MHTLRPISGARWHPLWQAKFEDWPLQLVKSEQCIRVRGTEAIREHLKRA